MPNPARKPTSLTLDRALLDEAKALGVNISRAAETGLAAAVKQARAEAWKRENAEGIQATNDYIEKYGLPLAQYRMF